MQFKIRRSFQGSRPRSQAPNGRLDRLRNWRLERRALPDRAQRRVGIFGAERVDNHRHESSSAAGLGGVRYRVLHSLLRLQRYVSFEGAGAPERQYFRGVGDGRKRWRDWKGINHCDRARLRSAMSILRRRQHSCARLGSSHLRRFLHRARVRQSDEARSGKNATRG